MNKDELLEIYRDAKNEASDLNVEELLTAINNSKNDYLENKTLTTIAEEIVEEVFKLPCHVYTDEKKMEICNKLKEYRYVGALNELRNGVPIITYRCKNYVVQDPDEPIRPIPTTPILGILLGTRFVQNGVQLQVLLCNSKRTVYNLLYDNYIVFQKLTPDERIILTAYNMLETGDTKLPDDSDEDDDECSIDNDTI